MQLFSHKLKHFCDFGRSAKRIKNQNGFQMATNHYNFTYPLKRLFFAKSYLLKSCDIKVSVISETLGSKLKLTDTLHCQRPDQIFDHVLNLITNWIPTGWCEKSSIRIRQIPKAVLTAVNYDHNVNFVPSYFIERKL